MIKLDTSLAAPLDTVILSDDAVASYLWWQDETEWRPVQDVVEYSTTGTLLVDRSEKLAGRPITLVGDESTAWMRRGVVLSLMELAATATLSMTLTIHSRHFSVIFDLGEGVKTIDVEPLVRISPPADTDYYTVKALHFLALAEIITP